MNYEPDHKRRSGRGYMIIGIIMLVLGTLLIADLMNIANLEISKFVFSWQAVLIVIGIVFLSQRDNRTTGWILLAIGSFFLMPKVFDHYHIYPGVEWNRLFWPSMIILAGLLIIFTGNRHRHRKPSFHKSSENVGDDYLDDVIVFGGGDKNVNSSQFKGGKITHVFGGSKYNFYRADLAPGHHVLEVTMVFGGTKFIVPDEWDIRLEVSPVLGGFSDKRIRSDVPRDPGKSLTIRGTCVFGGGEITNFI